MTKWRRAKKKLQMINFKHFNVCMVDHLCRVWFLFFISFSISNLRSFLIEKLSQNKGKKEIEQNSDHSNESRSKPMKSGTRIEREREREKCNQFFEIYRLKTSTMTKGRDLLLYGNELIGSNHWKKRKK